MTGSLQRRHSVGRVSDGGHGARGLPLLHDDVDDGLGGEPDAVPGRRGHDVPLGLGVEALGLNPEVVAVLVHELPLLPVHHVERELAALLFGLFSQLDEFGQLVVDLAGQRKLSASKVLEELGVRRSPQLALPLRILDLEGERESLVPLHVRAVLIALQDPRVSGLGLGLTPTRTRPHDVGEGDARARAQVAHDGAHV